MKKLMYLLCVGITVFNTIACVQKNNHKVDVTSEIQCCSYDLYRFREAGNGFFGFMDRFDQVIIGSKYQEARQFSEGLAAVCQSNKWGFIDVKDNIVIPFQYDWVSSFGEYNLENIAMIRVGIEQYRVPLNMGGEMGFINRNGELITPMKYKNFQMPFSGLMLISNQEDRWGAISMKAEEIIPCQYDNIRYNNQLDSLFLYKNDSVRSLSIEELKKDSF